MIVVFTGLIGLFIGMSSRRLLGDYLAIVTLFFGQAFVVFTNAADPYGITNGSNGLANVAPLTFFGGHFTIDTTRGLRAHSIAEALDWAEAHWRQNYPT